MVKRARRKLTFSVTSRPQYGTRNWLRVAVRAARHGRRNFNVSAELPPRVPSLIHNGRKP